MFCTREPNYRLYRVHERALRTISENYISSFSDLVISLNEKTIHQMCINVLMNKVIKYLNGPSPDLMNEAFRLKSNYYNLRNFNQFETYFRKTKSSLNSCVYRENQLWQLVPPEVRKSMSLRQFKSKFFQVALPEMPSHLCKQYIKNVGRFFSYYV